MHVYLRATAGSRSIPRAFFYGPCSRERKQSACIHNSSPTLGPVCIMYPSMFVFLFIITAGD